jgi:hypothetical protein
VPEAPVSGRGKDPLSKGSLFEHGVGTSKERLAIRPIALAALMLMESSYFVGARTRRSAGVRLSECDQHKMLTADKCLREAEG